MVHNLDDVAKVFGDVLGGLMSCFYQTMRVVVPVGTVVKTRYPFMDSTVHIGDLPAEMEAIILAQLPVGSTVLLKGYDLTKKDSIAMECVVEANYDAADQLNGTAHILRFEVIELLDRFVAMKGYSKHRAHHAHHKYNNYEKELIADLDACKARIEAHKAQQYHVLWDILIKELITCQRALHSNEPVDYTAFTQHGECLGLLRGMSSTDSDGQGYQFSNGLQRELSDQLHYNVTHTQEKEPLLSQSRQESVLGPPLLQERQTQDYEPLFPVAAHPSDLSNPSNPFDDMYDATPALNSNSENSPIMMQSNTCLDESLANKIYQVIPAVIPADIPADISTNTFAPLVRHYNM